MYIRNNMIVGADMKMSELILNNNYIILMLEHFGIDLVVQDKTIQDICLQHKINPELFIAFANLFNGTDYEPDRGFTYQDMATMIDYLNSCHQYYLEEKYPKINKYIDEMIRLNDHAEILLVKKFFEEYFKEVRLHMQYETETVFPYISNQLSIISQQSPAPGSKSAESNKKEITNYSIKDYKDQHNDIEEKLTDLKNLLLKYLPPKNDRQIRRKLLISLLELEYDLNIHTLIEDKILIPLAEKFEETKI